MGVKVKVVLDSEGRFIKEAAEDERGVYIHENHFNDIKGGKRAYVGGKLEKCQPREKTAA